MAAGLRQGTVESARLAQQLGRVSTQADSAASRLQRTGGNLDAFQIQLRKSASTLTRDFGALLRGANLDQTARLAAQKAASGLAIGFNSDLAAARQALAQGLIDPAEFQRRATTAFDAFAAALRQRATAVGAQVGQLGASTGQLSGGLRQATTESVQLGRTLSEVGRSAESAATSVAGAASKLGTFEGSIRKIAAGLSRDFEGVLARSDLDEAGRLAARRLAAGLQVELNLQLAKAREDLAAGVIDPAQFEARAKTALDAFAARVRQEIASINRIPPPTGALGVTRALMEAEAQARANAAALNQVRETADATFSRIQLDVRAAQAAFRAGTISVNDYRTALAFARQEAVALSQRTGQLTEKQLAAFNGILLQTQQRTRTAGTGLSLLRSGLAQLAIHSLSTGSAVGSVAQGLLLLGGGSGLVIGVAAGLAAIAAGYRFITRDARAAKERSKELREELRKFAEEQVPESARDLSNLNRLRGERDNLIAELAALEERRRSIPPPGPSQQSADVAAARAFALEQQIARKREEIFQQSQTITIAQEKRDQSHLDALEAEVQRLTQARDLGIATEGDMLRSVELAGELQQRIAAASDPKIRLQLAETLRTLLSESETSRARREGQQASIQQELQREQALGRSLEQINQQQFDRNLISLASFFDTRLALIRTAAAEEVAALQQQLALVESRRVQTPAEAIQRENEAARIRAELDQRTIAAAQQERDLQKERRGAEKALAEERLGFELEIQQARGETLRVALTAIDQEAQRFREVLARTGVGKADQDARVALFRDTLRLRAQAEQIQARLQEQFAALETERQRIANAVTTGLLTERQGQEQLAALELSRLGTLRQLASEAAVLASRLGDPALIQSAQQLQAQLDTMAASADIAGQRTAEMTADIESGFSSSFITFLEEATDRTNKLTDAVVSLGASLLRVARDIANRQITDALASGLFGGAGSPVIPAAPVVGQQIPSEDLAAAPSFDIDLASGRLTEASVALGASATTLVGGAGDLGTAAGLLQGPVAGLSEGAVLVAGASLLGPASTQLQGAASTLLTAALALQAANATKAIPGVGLAAGGYISGPGTGTSDSIAAWLSDGEFVINSRATARHRSLLEWVNSGGPQLQPPRARDGAPRFNRGGLVRDARAGASSIAASLQAQIGVGLEPGLIERAVERYIRSPDGSQVVVQVVKRNPNRFGDALRLRNR